MPTTRFVLASLLLAFALVPCAFAASPGAGLSVGATAPGIARADLDGEFVVVGDWLKGSAKAVVVTFFADWCEGCKLEGPELVRLANAFGAPQLRVLAIGTGMDKARSAAFLKAHYLDASRPDSRPVVVVQDDNQYISELYGVVDASGKAGLPFSVVIGRSGTIAFVLSSYTPAGFQDLEATVRRLIDDKDLHRTAK